MAGNQGCSKLLFRRGGVASPSKRLRAARARRRRARQSLRSARGQGRQTWPARRRCSSSGPRLREPVVAMRRHGTSSCPASPISPHPAPGWRGREGTDALPSSALVLLTPAPRPPLVQRRLPFAPPLLAGGCWTWRRRGPLTGDEANQYSVQNMSSLFSVNILVLAPVPIAAALGAGCKSHAVGRGYDARDTVDLHIPA